MAMQLPLQLATSLTLTSWLEDFRVKHSALQVNSKDLVTHEERSFLISHGFVQKNDPDIWYLKMLKVYLVMTADKLSREYLGFLPTWGIELNGRDLTAKNFGVPQNRERVFIVGYLGERSGQEIFPLTTYSQSASVVALQQLNKAESQGNRICHSSGVATTLASQAGGLGAKTGLYQIDTQVRRLTPTECERLQGFPDGWTAGLSDTQRYKTLGNAVTVPVVTAVMNQLVRTFINDKASTHLTTLS